MIRLPRVFKTRPLVHLVLLASVSVAACSNLLGPSENVIMMDIAPQRVSCIGVFEQQCFLVRQYPDFEWKLFYDSIEGFTFEPGFAYTVQVDVQKVKNPPSDAPNRTFRLLNVVLQTPSY